LNSDPQQPQNQQDNQQANQQANNLFGNFSNIFGMFTQVTNAGGQQQGQNPGPQNPNNPNIQVQGPTIQRINSPGMPPGTIHITNTRRVITNPNATNPNISGNLSSNNPSASGVQSINDNAMNLNFPRVEGNSLNTEQPVTYSLQHSQLHNCNLHLQRVSGAHGNMMFAPEVPRLSGDRNSLSLLGNYLRLLLSQLENINPMLRRASDLLERENLLQGRSRVDFGEFSHNIGNALSCLANGISSVAPLMRDLRFAETGFGVVNQPRNANPNAPPNQPQNTPVDTDRVEQLTTQQNQPPNPVQPNQPETNQMQQNQAQQAQPQQTQPQNQNVQSNPQVNVQISSNPVNMNDVLGQLGGMDFGALLGNLGPMMGQMGQENQSQNQQAQGTEGQQQQGQLGGMDFGALLGNLGPMMAQMGQQNQPQNQQAQPTEPQQQQTQENSNNQGQNQPEGSNQQNPGIDLNNGPLGGMISNLLGPGGMTEIQSALGGNSTDPQVSGLVNMANNMFANMQGGQGIDLNSLFAGLNQPQQGANANLTTVSDPNIPENIAQVVVEVEIEQEVQDDEWQSVDEELGQEEVAPEQNPNGNLQGLMNSVLNMDLNASMGNFIRENNLLDDGEGEYDILGLCVSELNMSELSVLLLGDLRPLTTKHEQIRKRIRDLIEKENNDMEVIKEKFSGDFQLSFDKILNEQDSEIKLFEGFSCNATVRSVVDRNFDKIIDVILRDYTPESSPSFGEAYAEVFKNYIGEMAYEVSLGFENGLNGLQILIRRYNRDYIMRTSNNEQMAGMADAMFGRTIWNKVLEWYHEFKTEKENEQKRA